MFKSNYKNLISNTLILIVFLGIGLVFNTSSVSAYVSQAEYTISENDFSGTNSYAQNPVPSLFAINPNYGSLNSGEKVITLTGSDFTKNSIARFDSSNRPTIYIDSTRLQMKLYPADLSTLGAHRVSVFNPLPGGGYTNSLAYNVISGGVVKGATTTKVVNSTPRKTASIVLAKDTDYKVSCEDDNYGAVYGASTSDGSDGFYGNQNANVLSAGSSFLPNTLFQWLVLAFLVFLAVVIWRKVTRTDAEKNAPLKHA